jgi:uncharacterized protein YciI
MKELLLKYLAVVREGGPAWDASVSMREQKHWRNHVAFMDDLAEWGVIVLGGPLGFGERRFLLIFNVDSKENVVAALAPDPWTKMGLLEIGSIELWEILLTRFSLILDWW